TSSSATTPSRTTGSKSNRSPAASPAIGTARRYPAFPPPHGRRLIVLSLIRDRWRGLAAGHPGPAGGGCGLLGLARFVIHRILQPGARDLGEGLHGGLGGRERPVAAAHLV